MKNLFGRMNKMGRNDNLGDTATERKNNKTHGKNFSERKRGFTLVEILIVVAIIGILFISLVPRIDFAGDKARETGIKTDFRSFELAAEQLIRENAGLADYDDVAELCGDNGINLYLDDALKFDDTGVSNKDDQWNQPYTVQIIKDASDANPNNGVLVFVSNGKDSVIGEEDDNYAIAITYVNGQIETETVGFSSNIESDGIAEILAGTANFTVDESAGHSVTYAN